MTEKSNVEQRRIDSYLKNVDKRILIRKIAWVICLGLFVLSTGILIASITGEGEVLLIDVGRLFLYGLPLVLMTRDKRKLINKDMRHPRRTEIASAALAFLDSE